MIPSASEFERAALVLRQVGAATNAGEQKPPKKEAYPYVDLEEVRVKMAIRRHAMGHLSRSERPRVLCRPKPTKI